MLVLFGVRPNLILSLVTVQCSVASDRIRYIFVLPENARVTVSLAGFH